MACKPKGVFMAKIGINGFDTVARIDSDAEPCILNSAWIDKMKFRRVKCMGLPVKCFDEIKCPTKVGNRIVGFAAREATVHAAITESSQFGENMLLRNDVLDVLETHSRLSLQAYLLIRPRVMLEMPWLG